MTPNQNLTLKQEEELTKLRELLKDQYTPQDRWESPVGDISEIIGFLENTSLPEEVYKKEVWETIWILKYEYDSKIEEMFGVSASEYYHRRNRQVAKRLIRYMENIKENV